MSKQKKVGIITFHCVDNFGAVLQCYALQESIKRMGVDVEVIDYAPKCITKAYSVLFNPFKNKNIKQYLFFIKIIASFVYYLMQGLKQKYEFILFRKEYLCVSKKRYRNYEEICELGNHYSHYITGSDQVWNPKIICGFDPVYFLRFAPGNAIRIAYAVSLGEDIEGKYYPEFRKSIDQFDSVSVREESSQAFIAQFTDKEVNVTLDPTFLISPAEYNIICVTPRHDNYILVYDIWFDSNLVDIVNAVAKKLNLNVISFRDARNYEKGKYCFSMEGPGQFLGLLRYADFVISTSFHGTTFSIIYNKNFITVPHPKRGGRMVDILNKLQLKDRLIISIDDLKIIDITADIDYSEVNKTLNDEKEKSIAFLKDALDILK